MRAAAATRQLPAAAQHAAQRARDEDDTAAVVTLSARARLVLRGLHAARAHQPGARLFHRVYAHFGRAGRVLVALRAANTARSVALNTARSVALNTARSVALNTARSVALNTARAVALNTARYVALNTARSVALNTARSVALSVRVHPKPGRHQLADKH